MARLAKLRGHAHGPIGTRSTYYPHPVLEIGRDTISTSAAVDDVAGRLWWNAVLESLRWSNFDEIRTHGDLFFADPPRKGADVKFTE